ncbi:MAG: MFS transporter [Clostridia bacterium]|nr:MFS transporter [Clostridia bacterium]
MKAQAEQSNQAREKDPYKKSRVMYIIEAAVEYFIATMIAGTYLAKVTDAIGMTDAQTGIVSSFVSLGLGFQLISILLSRFTPVKRWVSVLNTLNQLLFSLVYAVPFVPISQSAKIALFVILLLGGELVANVVNSPKTNWLMSLVPDRQRGRFTANKEIVSLLGGVVFSFVMGALNDHFHAIGRSDIAFMICGFTIFGLALIHTLTLVLSKEKPVERKPQAIGKQLSALVRDKNLWAVIVVCTLFKISQYAVTPFLGTYQNKELGFTLVFVSVITAVGSVARASVSRPIGRFADKTSFSHMLQFCFLAEAAGYLVLIFTTPANGHVMFVIYRLLNAVAMAGINSGCINLVYDYVAPDRRVGAFALQNTVAGTAGFLTTLVASAFVDHVQAQGNRLFGLHVYAQQALAVIGLVICLLIVVYLRTVVARSQRAESSDTV